MENYSNTTCFISLEKPLTVTFTVDDVERGYDWANHVSGKHPDNRKCDIYSVLKDFGSLCGVPRSLSDSDIFNKFQDNDDFSACDENLKPENRTGVSTNRCCDAVHKSPAEEQETRLTDNADNTGGCSLPGTKERNRFAENRFEELAAGPVLGDREEQNLILDVTSPRNSRSGNFIGSDNSFRTEISRCANGTVLPFAGHFRASGSRNDDPKLKNDKIQLDLGYFTEEGNEGGRDEEECSDDLTGASNSHRLSANDYCCCNDVRPQRVARSPSVPPRSGILKHSRTSYSFDISSSALTAPKENHNCADCYQFLSNSPSSARNVAFLEPPISVYKWRFAVDLLDGSRAMEKVRAVANHLCLPAHNANRKDERIENRSPPVTDQRRKTGVGLGADAWEAETSRVNPAIVYDNVNEFFSRIKQELFQLRKADERIASRLLVLYGEIKQFKYIHNCHLYREMMEAAIDNEDKKDELFRHHVDTIPERLCATFKHWGLTRINLQRRRFSIF